MKKIIYLKKTKGGKPKMKRTTGLIALMAVLMIGTVYALTCTFDQASTTIGTRSGYVSGSTQNISVTISAHGVGHNITTGTLSAATCTITGALISNITATGVTDNTTYMNFTVNTGAMRDDTSCQFAIAVKNGTNQNAVTCTNSGGLYIADNTKPVCTHSQSSKTTYNPEQTWTITGTNGSSATIQFGPNKIYTMTEDSDTFTYTTSEGELVEGTYKTVKGVTSDGLNSTDCTDLEYVRIDSEAKLVQVAILASQGQKGQQQATGSKNNAGTIVLIFGALLLIWHVRKNK